MSQDAGADVSGAPLGVDEAKAAALKQVEFYFADANLPFDKFLFTLTRKDPEGWVPIDTLASFKRMKPLREVLDVAGIADALRASPSLLEVDAEGQRVRRRTPLVPVPDAHTRSIYAKGFPDEHEGLQAELEKFFAQFGKINGVRMRRENERPRAFKHSVFVEFASADEMQAFLERAKAEEPEQDGGHAIKYTDGTKLLVMSKPAYVSMKMKEKGIDPSQNPPPSKGGRKFNAFREMERERQGAGAAPANTRAEPLEFEYNGSKLTTRPDGTVDAEQVAVPAQSVLRFTGAAATGSWKDLKDTLTTLHPTSFVEFPAEATEGVVGFRDPVSDEKLAQIQEHGITVGGQPVQWARVGEEEARAFYVERANFRASFLLDRREAERHAPRRRARTATEREAQGERAAGRGGQAQQDGGIAT
ncbi:unnamed protein product [Malassezia sympodialis ATCC 42132]|uniref:uncharacterized protein n=1 Tax=Malassezia sympodialis (strain ATCC 42132) TaxID=1230383 RepID=UPI0002C2D028|nr:uncharacterized protein MSY001_2002 [Malassezia sympodialis ATCC 42132]CCU99296.1 unnamed protein product [Malassezia sympodialis ATCC 42132]|eukprot:XP_018740552.1 uncharacterized protein MSY001_2002 [Malassezia sympodialis ATCC 42132]